MNMTSAFQYNVQLLVLSVLSCASLMFSLSFYLKYRVLRKDSKNARVNAYDETFKVVSPYPEHRQIINNIVIPLILAVVLPFSLGFAVLKILEIGLASSILAVILWLSLMMLDPAFEIYKNTNIFLKAFRNKVNLGKGDLAALFFLRKTMPRLSVYYLLLTITFSISSMMLPYITSTAILVLSQFVNLMTEPVSFYGVVGAFAGLLPLATLTMLILVVCRIVKTKVFYFAPSVPFNALEEQFMHVKIMTTGDAPPFELSHRPMLEDTEVEEKKRRWLMRSR
jgi:hypothetical protein